MDSQQLREYFKHAMGLCSGIDSHKCHYNDEMDDDKLLDNIMAKTKDHVNYVIGPDEPSPVDVEHPHHEQHVAEVERDNELKAEQRNRAGAY